MCVHQRRPGVDRETDTDLLKLASVGDFDAGSSGFGRLSSNCSVSRLGIAVNDIELT
jgi:hypothetical protein